MAMKKEIIISWMLLVTWMIFIFIMSSFNDNISSYQSNTIATILYSIFNIESNSNVIFIIRKFAHVSEYFVLGILTFNLVSKYGVKLTYLFSFLFCILYASSDEFHQLFVSGRVGSITDIFIDMIGIITALLIMYLFNKFRTKSFSNDNS